MTARLKPKPLKGLVLNTVILFTACLMTACSLDRWIGVNTGEYVVSREGGWANRIAQREIEKVIVDRGATSLSLSYRDGTWVTVAFAALERADWPSGCPGNLYATRMEVLDLEVDQLTVGSLTLDDPVLVRDCPPEPVQVVLMQAGPIGGGGNACGYQQACVFLEEPYGE
jgi:hypothetical protein